MAHVNKLNNGTNGALAPVQWNLLGSNGSYVSVLDTALKDGYTNRENGNGTLTLRSRHPVR